MWIAIGVVVGLLVVAVYDMAQTRHAILRNFPVIGHLRYFLEHIGPEFRQYIVTNDNEERPFTRFQRRWIYASAKKTNNYFGFGTSLDLEQTPNHILVKHDAFPVPNPQPGDDDYDSLFKISCAKVLGGHRERRLAFRPSSVINLSGMSFGSLSGPAISALNRGAQLSGCLHNTGEGGVSKHHLQGGDLILQVGTGYFGCRDQAGKFDINKLTETVATNPIRAIEIKLSQGAKPGVGGLLPAAKITREIAEARGIPMGKDCASPNAHSAFHDVDSMLDFVEQIADTTGLPVGIKSAVGQMGFWRELAEKMAESNRGVDFITIDGGEGGTGAAPLVFSDHVALPFKLGMSQVYGEFERANMQDKVVFAGSGKLGFPEAAFLAFGMGCDLVNVAREAMLAIGCIQAQRCHTGFCPAGIATQNKWLMRGLDPTSKSARLANYIVALRKDLLRLSRACGENHPALVTLDHFAILDTNSHAKQAVDVFGYAAASADPTPPQANS